MVVETESTKNQPVDISSDLFEIEHQWLYLKYKLLSDIFFKQKSTGTGIKCQIYIFVLHYLCFCLHLKPRGRTTFNTYCFRG
jgi:hypothetical protein